MAVSYITLKPRSAICRAMQAERKVLPSPVAPEKSRLPPEAVKPAAYFLQMFRFERISSRGDVPSLGS